MFILSEKSLNKLKGVHPDVVTVFKESIKNSPYDFRITHGVRTAEEQNKLYQCGRTIKGLKVTNCDGYIKKSNHQAKNDGYGYAVDIFICGYVKDGKYIKTTSQEGYEYSKLKAVAEHIKAVAKSLNINISWGGDWTKFKDYPHFELRK